MAIMKIVITKGKGEVEIDTDKVPEPVYAEALRIGFKEMANRKMTKIQVAKLEGDDLAKARAAAMAQAEKNLEDIMSGKIKIAGVKAEGKASGEVMTEARRLARNIVKDEIKRQGGKVSHVEASEITKAANALIAADPSIIDQAKESLEKRKALKVAIDVSAIPVSAKLVAAAEAKKKDKGSTLSAAQASKPAKGKKGKAQAQLNA